MGLFIELDFRCDITVLCHRPCGIHQFACISNTATFKLLSDGQILH